MSDLVFCKESEVKEALLDLLDREDEAPHIFVAYREEIRNSYNRSVTFVIQTKEGNDSLIDRIVKASTKNDRAFRFVKSDMNIESGNLTIDYLYIEAVITPNLT